MQSLDNVYNLRLALKVRVYSKYLISVAHNGGSKPSHLLLLRRYGGHEPDVGELPVLVRLEAVTVVDVYLSGRPAKLVQVDGDGKRLQTTEKIKNL